MIDSLQTAAASMEGTLHGEDARFSGVSTDTRTLRAGELFFALRGPSFDGCEFVGAARKRGAAGAVVPHPIDEQIPQIAVADTRRALGRFAAAWRNEQDLTVIGITGSNGKTTVKELVRACVSQCATTLATQGNLNNDIGLPLMLARLDASHQFGVFEMGANHAGEIAHLTALARPDIVVITNAAAAHLEGFGSLDGVAEAKGEILRHPARPRVAVLNADDHYFDYWCSLVTDVETISFGISSSADVHAEEIETGAERSLFLLRLPDTDITVDLPLAGSHNVRNACAAAAVALALDIDATMIKRGLESVSPVGGRMQPLQGLNGAALFDDSYNANPRSVLAAAEFLANLAGESWLVLGDMKELGNDAAQMHREVGEAARSYGIDRLFALGDLSQNTVQGFGERGRWYCDIDDLIDDLGDSIADGVNVLVKGSRSMQMERVVAALREPETVRREA
jgi:UDP-N-acetylmuramoyl-tripeptide--D-alanyl-D-alanine ligase